MVVRNEISGKLGKQTNRLTDEINIHGTFETFQEAFQSIYDWWENEVQTSSLCIS